MPLSNLKGIRFFRYLQSCFLEIQQARSWQTQIKQAALFAKGQQNCVIQTKF